MFVGGLPLFTSSRERLFEKSKQLLFSRVPRAGRTRPTSPIWSSLVSLNRPRLSPRWFTLLPAAEKRLDLREGILDQVEARLYQSQNRRKLTNQTALLKDVSCR